MADTTNMVTLRALVYVPRAKTGGGYDNGPQVPPGEVFHAPQGFADYLVVNHYAERVREDEYPVYIGGGYYELADGSTVRGKDEAMAANSGETE